MRGTVAGLASPYPIGGMLPAVFQEDEFVQRFTAGLDDVVAPVVSTLDCLEHYLDPALAPEDFLPWLAGWLDMDLGTSGDLVRRRRLLAAAGDLYRRRGTLGGLRDHLWLLFGGQVEVADGTRITVRTTASPQGGAEDPQERPSRTLRVRIAPEEPVDHAVVDRFVAAAKPAHLPHVVEVIAG
ncbi:phage tail protein [Streptomyces erythrochromogenes]|uniref:phage tail protein n=1 Tax=Streptomyces erythrochromogenes TaxID=285574 RepID=UPI00343170C1